ncbi:fibronectin type III domain-containing protein [Paucibacter sp. AS339]|uniref:fibronectin type III domain-containing protein n=1 Tax=Paucibacter hankyongi TaxID=3133434 RepID=UPI0030B431D4
MHRNHQTSKHLGLSFGLALALAACGGGGGSSTPSTPDPVIPPAPANTAPSNVSLVAITAQDSVSLSAVWLPAQDAQTASGQLKYELHVSAPGARPDFEVSASTLKASSVGSTSAQITGLQAGSAYQAVSKAGDSLVFDSAQASPVNAGEVIASSAGDDYVRRVTAVTLKGGKTVLSTKRASVNEVYKQLGLNSTGNRQPVAASVATGRVSAQSLLQRAAAGRSQAAADSGDRKRILAVELGEGAPLGKGPYGWATGATNAIDMLASSRANLNRSTVPCESNLTAVQLNFLSVVAGLLT